MNVYVESNFVLELALQQEEWQSCDQIVELAREGHCQLLIPALALAEPHGAIHRKNKVRNRLSGELQSHFRDMGRSESSRHLPQSFQALSDALIDTGRREETGLYLETRRLLDCAIVLPLTVETLHLGLDYGQRYELAAADAIMLASVIAHAEGVGNPSSLFMNKNTKDFDDPDVTALLEAHGCTLSPTFAAGVRHVHRVPEEGQR